MPFGVSRNMFSHPAMAKSVVICVMQPGVLLAASTVEHLKQLLICDHLISQTCVMTAVKQMNMFSTVDL